MCASETNRSATLIGTEGRFLKSTPARPGFRARSQCADHFDNPEWFV